MLGEAIRLYRCKHRLTQRDFANKVLLNQTDISDLETDRPETIALYQTDVRFSELRSFLEKASESDPIQLYRGSSVPLIETEKEWIAVVPFSRVEECYRLFAGLDVAIVVQDFQEAQYARS